MWVTQAYHGGKSRPPCLPCTPRNLSIAHTPFAFLFELGHYSPADTFVVCTAKIAGKGFRA